jgi:hypothetical protein
LLALWVLGSCAAPPRPPESPPEPPAVAEEASPSPAVSDEEPEKAAEPRPSIVSFPDRCTDESAPGICSPPLAFARDICGGFARPEIALTLFAKGSPWTRAYLRLNVDGWYAGGHSTRVALKFDEEVVVLHHRNATGGIVVSGGGAPFEVMRLDGNCATLAGDELTLKRPRAPQHPPVPWRQLDPRVRERLLTDPAVALASSGHDSACAEPSQACTKAANKLTTAILDFMARGAKIPALLSRR